MIDGVDEILDSSLRIKALQIIQFHRESGLYKFLIASRPLPKDELDILAVGGFQQYFLEPLAEEMLPVLAARWFDALGLPDQEVLMQRFRLRIQHYHLRQLARTPLIATMICLIFAHNLEAALPITRAELYMRFVNVLFEKQVVPLDVRSRLKARVHAYGPTVESAIDLLLDRLHTLLEEIAYKRQSGSLTSVLMLALDDLRDLRPVQITDESWKDVVREVLRQSGLLVERGGDVNFIHQTIEEYLTACRIASDSKPNIRGAGDLLTGTGVWEKFTVEVRLFVLGIWTSQGFDLSDLYRQMIKRAKTESDGSFIASLVIDGAQLPDDCLDSAARSLTDLLSISLDRGTLSVGTVGMVESVGMLVDTIHIKDAIAKAPDHRLSLTERNIGVTMLTAMDVRGYYDKVLALTDESEPLEIRIAAATALNQSGYAEGRRVLSIICNNAELAENYRVSAASVLAFTDERSTALNMLTKMARDASRPPLSRIASAIMARWADPRATVTLLLELSEELRIPGEAAFMVARALCSQGHPRGLQIYWNSILNSDLDVFIRLEAVSWLSGMVLMKPKWIEFVKGGYMLIACDANVPVELRVTLCERLEGLSKGRAEMAYRKMALDQGVDDVRRLEAARALFRLKSPNSVNVLKSLAQDSALSRQLRQRISELIASPTSD